MSMILIFARYHALHIRVLRYGKGLSLVDPVRFGLWLARG